MNARRLIRSSHRIGLEELPYSSPNRRDEGSSIMALTGRGRPRASPSLDHLVGAGEEGRGEGEAEGPDGLQVDRQSRLIDGLDREIAGESAGENAGNVTRRARPAGGPAA
jgi:hypothetical protein